MENAEDYESRCHIDWGSHWLWDLWDMRAEVMFIGAPHSDKPEK